MRISPNRRPAWLHGIWTKACDVGLFLGKVFVELVDGDL